MMKLLTGRSSGMLTEKMVENVGELSLTSIKVTLTVVVPVLGEVPCKINIATFSKTGQEGSNV